MHCHLHRGDWNFHLTNEKKKKKVEGIDGGLHPAVDSRQWRALMEGYILQWTVDSGGH